MTKNVCYAILNLLNSSKVGRKSESQEDNKQWSIEESNLFASSIQMNKATKVALKKIEAEKKVQEMFKDGFLSFQLTPTNRLQISSFINCKI